MVIQIKYALKGVIPDSPSISGSLIIAQNKNKKIPAKISEEPIIFKNVVNVFMINQRGGFSFLPQVPLSLSASSGARLAKYSIVKLYV